MNDFEIHHELGVFVLEGMVTMGRRHQDPFNAAVDKGLDVFPGKAFEYLLIAGLANALPAAILPGAQNTVVQAGFVQNFGGGPGHFFQSRIVAEVAAGEI